MSNFAIILHFVLVMAVCGQEKIKSLCDNPKIAAAVSFSQGEVWYIRDELYWVGHGLPQLGDTYATGPYRLLNRLIPGPGYTHKKGEYWTTMLTTDWPANKDNLYVFHPNYLATWWRWANVNTPKERQFRNRTVFGLAGVWPPGAIYRPPQAAFMFPYKCCIHNGDAKSPRAICIYHHSNKSMSFHYFRTGQWHFQDLVRNVQRDRVYNLASVGSPIIAGFVDTKRFIYVFTEDGKLHQRQIDKKKDAWRTTTAFDFFGCGRDRAPNVTVAPSPNTDETPPYNGTAPYTGSSLPVTGSSLPVTDKTQSPNVNGAVPLGAHLFGFIAGLIAALFHSFN